MALTAQEERALQAIEAQLTADDRWAAQFSDQRKSRRRLSRTQCAVWCLALAGWVMALVGCVLAWPALIVAAWTALMWVPAMVAVRRWWKT